VLGVAAVDLTTGQMLIYNAEVVFPQASSIKIPIMIRVFEAAAHGKVTLHEKITMQPADAVGGSGHLRSLLRAGPVTLSVEHLVIAMIESSDNTATNVLIRLVGMDSVNAMLHRLGFRKTRLGRVMLDAPAARRGDENVSTPLEMARLMELIYSGKAVDQRSSNRMLEILQLVDADFRRAIPSAVPVASKPGQIAGVRCETGIVMLKGRPFALSVASSFLDGAISPVPEAVRIVFRHFEKLAASNDYGHRVH
jgi:beta-lactamase class A